MPVNTSINGLFDKGWPKVFLLFGEERFLLEEAYDKIIKLLLPDEQSAYDFETLDGNETDFNRIVDSCLSYPFVSEKRIVVVSNFEKLTDKLTKKDDVHNGFVRYLENPQESTVLVLVADIPSLNGLTKDLSSQKNKAKAEKKMSLLQFPYDVIFSKYQCIEFPKVYESAYEGWISSRVKTAGKTIDPSAIELIIAHTNTDLREINQEIEKLIILVGKNQNITIEDVTISLGANKIYNVFELQKAVGKRRLEDSLSIMQKMLENDRQEILIVTILTRFFINLWRLEEVINKNNNQYVIASSIGISPYFVSEYTESLKLYKTREIEKAIKMLASADEKLKSSSASPRFLLEALFVDIMD